MPNQRQAGTKLAGAYISADKDKALAEIAALKGYENKADFLRALFDAAIEESEKALKMPKRKKQPPSLNADRRIAGASLHRS